MRKRTLMIVLSAVAATAALRIVPADAGCGCNKPPPPVAQVRPAFASPGDSVTLFPTDNTAGTYDVMFDNGSSTATMRDVSAVYKRDLADGQYKWQVVVKAPVLWPGPTSITMRQPSRHPFAIPSSGFTLMQPAVILQQGDGETLVKCYRSAVTADGTVLIPVDISAISDHMLFSGLAERYPLLFGAPDITIYNAQGFLMQLLTPANASIYAITDPGDPDSFELTYDRHEFNTYRAQHAHTGGYGLDPTDPAWHTDGTYHVDHNHLVIAIKGQVEAQGSPAPGLTPAFNFSVVTSLAETAGASTSRTLRWCGATPSNYANVVAYANRAVSSDSDGDHD